MDIPVSNSDLSYPYNQPDPRFDEIVRVIAETFRLTPEDLGMHMTPSDGTHELIALSRSAADAATAPAFSDVRAALVTTMLLKIMAEQEEEILFGITRPDTSGTAELIELANQAASA